jgi:hypothetical protein
MYLCIYECQVFVYMHLYHAGITDLACHTNHTIILDGLLFVKEQVAINVHDQMPIEFTRNAHESFNKEFKARIMQVYSHFPELHEKLITCGSMKKHGSIEGTAIGWTSPPVFRLQVNVSNYTIAHELTHLVQGNESGIPHGEVACDIWTIARMPAELLDQRPYYLLKSCRIDWKRSRGVVKALCIQAIGIRKTQRNYIVWLQGEIRKIKKNIY